MIMFVKLDTAAPEYERVSQELGHWNITLKKTADKHNAVIGLIDNPVTLNPRQVQQLSSFMKKIMQVDKPFKRVALEFYNRITCPIISRR